MLPHIKDQFNHPKGATYFSKISPRSVYHQSVENKSDDIQKIALCTRYGYYQFQAMPFGLTNVPAKFMEPMNIVFNPYLDEFIIVFINDILIYFKLEDEHAAHLNIALETIKEEKLYAKFSKYEFWLREVKMLGNIVSIDGILVDPQSKTPIEV